MSNRIYAYVGRWGRDVKKLGFGIYEYDKETAGLTFLKDSRQEDIHVGYTVLDKARGILYCVDEATDLPDMKGGGGRLFAWIRPDDSWLLLIMREGFRSRLQNVTKMGIWQ